MTFEVIKGKLTNLGKMLTDFNNTSCILAIEKTNSVLLMQYGKL